MSFDPNAVSLKRAYDKNIITEVLPDDTILVFRGDNETNYHTYRLQYNQLLTLVGANNLYFTTDRVLQSFARSNIYFTKPELSGGEQFIGASTIFDQFKIFYFSTSVPCRFRLYVNSSLRDSDLTRDGVTPPTGNHGCIFDSSLNVANDVDCYVTPVILAMSDSPGSNEFFYTIDTLGGGDIEVTVTLSIVVESNIYYEPA